jgi:hypothetical protein
LKVSSPNRNRSTTEIRSSGNKRMSIIDIGYVIPRDALIWRYGNSLSASSKCYSTGTADALGRKAALSDKWISGPVWQRRLSANATQRPLATAAGSEHVRAA